MKPVMIHKLFSIALALFLGGVTNLSVFAQNDHLLKVTDESGAPLSDVQVFVGKSFVYNTTDAEGVVIFKADKNEAV